MARQVRQVQEHCPDPYAYLAIERALARIPSRTDIELSNVFKARAYFGKPPCDLTRGVGDLCDGEARHG